MELTRDKDRFASADWYQALEFGVRLASLRHRCGQDHSGHSQCEQNRSEPDHSGGHPGSADGPIDAERAQRRIARWRRQAPYEQGQLWDRYLAALGIAAQELRILAGEPAEALKARTAAQPPWLVELQQAYRTASWEPLAWPASADAKRLPFLAVIEPVIAAARERLAAQAREIKARHPEAPFDCDSVVQVLSSYLPDLLVQLLIPTMVVELHAARLEERLTGATPETRFQSFIRSLRRRDAALEILARYPVLARKLVVRIKQWQDRGAEFLCHLASDAATIRERLAGGSDIGLLVAARGAISDSHRDGRGVLLLRFDSGLRLVYKPRSLAVDVAFQRLLAWVGSCGFAPGYRTLAIIDAGDHGWSEFAAAAPCQSTAEARRFYLRQGGYLAVLYLLDGTDFHHENMIAAGEHPLLVDLETLFQPWVHGPSLYGVEQLPDAPLHSVVLRTGLLPQRVWGDPDHAGVDLSGLGAQAEQLTPQPVLTTTNRLTDQMRVERRRIEIPLEDNRPRLGDRDLSPLDYTAELREGFRRMFRVLLTHREQLLAADGPLAGFATSEVRVIVRTTASYGSLLSESFHPHFLGNALEQEMLFGRLWGGVEQRPFLEQLVPYEIQDLERSDIPHFTTRPGSRDLYTATGERLVEFFADSGLERVRRRVAALSVRDLARQETAIDDSLTMARVSRGDQGRPCYDFCERPDAARYDELVAAARRVGERLVERAFVGPDEALWLTLDYRDPGGWTVVPAGPDFYLGLPGIAFALGYVGALTGTAEFGDLARRALRAQARQIEQDPTVVRAIGGFNGWGGIIYALTHLGALWDDGAVLDQAEQYAHRLLPLIAEDDLCDVIAGAAGCLLAVLALAEHRPSDRLIATARACGDRLLATAVRQERGLGWVTPLAGPRALAGISHGAAGVVLALLRLWAVTGDERYYRAAGEGLAFERSLYASAECNWPDLRAGAKEAAGPDSSNGEHFMWAWCHGAPGIGYARLAGLAHLDDAEVRQELDIAIATTLTNGFGNNHCLCHGDLGNLDFLLEAARVLGDEELRTAVYRRAGGVLANMDHNGWLFGLPGNMETPGLMAGLAGVAYGFARLADPERLPALLVLAAPATAKTE